MTAILKVKDGNGNVIPIQAIKGEKGEKGEKGDRGLPGSGGVPDGGTTGQVLTKNSDADGDAGWKDSSGGSYTLPVASSTTLGGVKIGSGISIGDDGTISASGGGSADAVLYTEQTLTNAQKAQARTNIGVDLTGYQKTADADAKYLPLTGGKAKGAIIAPSFQTGNGDTAYFQTKKMRGEGADTSYYHAVDWGYLMHNMVDFHEYGGVWNFYKNTAGRADSGTLVGKIDDNGWNGGAKLSGVPTAPTAEKGTNTTQIATTEFVAAAVPTADITANTAARHSHDNKTALDTITAAKITSWDGKVDGSQGTANAGKFLGIGADGIVVPTEVGGGSEWVTLFNGTIATEEAVNSMSADLLKSCEGMNEFLVWYTNTKNTVETPGNDNSAVTIGKANYGYGRFGDLTFDNEKIVHLLLTDNITYSYVIDTRGNSMQFNIGTGTGGWSSNKANPDYNKVKIECYNGTYIGTISLKIYGR